MYLLLPVAYDCQLVLVLQNNNLDWFPRMQAMSLVVTDGDGEQNEMRMLQDKLGATMNVVNTLTTQLTELKEQVHLRTS